MKIDNKNILLISPEPWNHIFVSKHHYAVHLANRGNRVFFLNPPSGTTKVAATAFTNLHSIDYAGFPVGLRWYPDAIRKRIVASVFRKLQEVCDVTFDVVWSFDNSVFFDFDALPDHVLKLSHIVDLNQDFQMKRAVQTADYSFCTTEQIKERLLKFNNNVFKIAHGYNQTFRQRLDNLPNFSARPKAFYAGNLAIPYIDWNLIDLVTAENSAVDFYFLGPGKLPAEFAKMNVINRPNCYFLGEIPPYYLQAYFDHADILFLAYDEATHRDQVANPHKMMEYLGSGKMVVATHTTEFTRYAGDAFLMAGRNSQFPSVFSRALDELAYWNSDALQRTRRAIALDNTYERQIERIERIIESR